MRTSQGISLLAIVIFVLLTFTYSAQIQALAKYGYAYLGFTRSELRIHVVDINANSTMLYQFSLPPETQTTELIYSSPTGEWIAFILEVDRQNNTQLVYLINLATGETRTITKGYLPDWKREIGFTAPPQRLAWSPDGRFMAFTLSPKDPKDKPLTQTYLYNLAENTLTGFTSQQQNDYRFAWSSDSQDLAIFSGVCTAGPSCQLALRIVEVSTGQVKSQLDITGLYQGSSVIGSTLCRLAWSPNKKFISFSAGCNSTTGNTPKELYLWEIEAERYIKVTQFTSGKLGFQYIWADYIPFWQSDSDLLFGMRLVTGQNSIYATYHYQVENQHLNQIATVAIEEWAYNLSEGIVIYRQVSQEGWAVPEAILSLESLDDLAVSLSSVPLSDPGCRLSWSPDGQWFAYFKGYPCSPFGRNLIILSSDNQTVRHYTLQPNTIDGELFTTPIGWLRMR